MWGNDQYGDCVTAEEAFAKACYQPEIFIPDTEVIRWARANGYLNGAYLEEVMDSMAKKGFQIGTQLYNDGPYYSVDYSNEPVLQAAIATGPVKIGIDSSALPSGAGNNQGWFALGGGNHRNEDHSVALSGYGPAAWLYQQLNVPLPSGLPGTTLGYLLFTWSTIGFVDHKWLMGACGEAWIRNPTTVGVPPLPGPTPPEPPTPPSPNWFCAILDGLHSWLCSEDGQRAIATMPTGLRCQDTEGKTMQEIQAINLCLILQGVAALLCPPGSISPLCPIITAIVGTICPPTPPAPPTP
jgi:hypothetical protein